MDGWTDSNMSYYIYTPEKKMTMYFTLIEKKNTEPRRSTPLPIQNFKKSIKV